MRAQTLSFIWAALIALTLTFGVGAATQAAQTKTALTEADMNAALQAALDKYKDLQ